MQNLVIVESPTKARTLSKYLGDKYQIEASMGHIRDLPKAEIGIDVAHNFDPKYIVPKDKIKRVNELKKLASQAENLWLATDPDREGEAISWHIKQLLQGGKSDKKQTVRRVVFHEITPNAIKEAFAHPGEINQQLVDAQQARRILDRLVGYKLSPLLWKKVKSGLSAGRVQSVTVRLVVEREREIKAFVPVEYWSIEVELAAKQGKFMVALAQIDGKKAVVNNKEESDKHVNALKSAQYIVDKITKKEVRRFPAAPFTTSTLQQTSSLRLGFSAKKTMSLAQFLYEHGLITYMRTDSMNLSAEAVAVTRAYITEHFGKEYLPAQSRVYKTKSKSAQEAHEAVRPTDANTTGEKLYEVSGLTRDHIRLYDLIWKRMVASQASEAVMDQTTIDVLATPQNPGESKYTLRATGSVIKFEGWLKIYGISKEEEEESPDGAEKKGQLLPKIEEQENLNFLKIIPLQHFTEPPPRFNEASLIKKLEELGIGRPSTYAPTLSTIQDRYYVEKIERKFIPTELGFAVTDFLTKNFPNIVDYTFTAGMEDQLDEVAEGRRVWQSTIRDFYTPFEKRIEETAETAERVRIESEVVDKLCPKCGKSLLIKFGKFGKFLACSGFPDCKHTEGLEERINVPCPLDAGELVMRRTKTGKPFYGCKNWPNCKYASWTKPK